MGKRVDPLNEGRFLYQRNGYWYYQRRIPRGVVDERGSFVKQALKTNDLRLARQKRDQLESADNALWAAFLVGSETDRARAEYLAAVKRVEAMGFGYKPAEVLSRLPDVGELLRRVEAMGPADAPVAIGRALTGSFKTPQDTILQAYDLFIREIAADEIVGKSEQQKRKWRNVKKRGVDTFVKVCGDMSMGAITRDHALDIWRFWQKRIAPTEKGAKPSHTASSGNREMGGLRTLYDGYYRHLGQMDRPNPFAGLSFKERGASKRKRPPFPVDWIRDVIMKPGALATMNDEARGILLAEIETGARPSELANLEPEAIRVDDEVPHIIVQPRDDPNDPRELKSEQSERIIPLIGISLEVFKHFRNGFPRYREREEAASAAINKYLRENDLMPSGRHTLYGLRHSLEDRMKDAGIGDELRRILMGHKVDREEYGTGGSLKWRHSELQKIALPFDKAIVTLSLAAVAKRGPGQKRK